MKLKDAYFNVHEGGREGIATGATAKHPMAGVDGTFVLDDAAFCFDGIEISFNPKSTHLFVDAEGYAVQYAEEVTILRNRAYARGSIRYFTEQTAPARPRCAFDCEDARLTFHPPGRLARRVFSGSSPICG